MIMLAKLRLAILITVTAFFDSYNLRLVGGLHVKSSSSILSRKSSNAGSEPVILVESLDNGNILHLMLNRPSAFNALSFELLSEMKKIFSRLIAREKYLYQSQSDQDVRSQDAGLKQPRVVIITGKGTAFCSGHDLKELRSMHESIIGSDSDSNMMTDNDSNSGISNSITVSPNTNSNLVSRTSQSVLEFTQTQFHDSYMSSCGPSSSSMQSQIFNMSSCGPSSSSMQSQSEDPSHQLFFLCCEVMYMIQVLLPQPVITQPHRIATAAGCQLVAASTYAISDPNCRFQTPGVDIGLFCSTPSVPLLMNVDFKPALRMLMTGESISAEEAKKINLINEIIQDNHMDSDSMSSEFQSESSGSELSLKNFDYTTGAIHPQTLRFARLLATKSSRVLAYGKRVASKIRELPTLEEKYKFATEAMTTNFRWDVCRQGIGCFIDKKKFEPNSKL